MATVVEFWEADGDGESLIECRRSKVLDAVSLAATARPERCVLVTLIDTRPGIAEIQLWIKPGYSSSCITPGQTGLLNAWKDHI